MVVYKTNRMEKKKKKLLYKKKGRRWVRRKKKKTSEPLEPRFRYGLMEGSRIRERRDRGR